jgi:sortase A
MMHLFQRSLGRRRTLLAWLERLLLAIGLICLGLAAFTVIDARWFAYRQGRRLDLALASRAAAPGAGRVDGAGSARASAAAGMGAATARGARRNAPARRGPVAAPSGSLESSAPPVPVAPEGSVLGRIEVRRVGISALILEGVAGSTLRRGVGHVAGTALPRWAGNVGLAGHRDTVFRGLKDIRKGDLVALETMEGTFRYAVDWTQVVEPRDVGVLAASDRPELTLVTCYPFFYVGPAPHRFVVRAHLLGAGAWAGPATHAAAASGASYTALKASGP